VGTGSDRKKRIAFIAHWVENWNWLLWNFPDLHTHPERHPRLGCLWPLYTSMSLHYLLSNKTHDIVDTFSFNGCVECDTVLLRNFAWHFLIPGYRDKIRERLVDAVLHAQENSHVIGLGALTKAEWLTQGGAWLIKRLGGQLRVPIVHGDTLTAAVVFRQALSVLSRVDGGPVFITGATSKIGRAVVLSLAKQQIPVRMFTQSHERFDSIREEARGFERYISRADSLEDGVSCALWITGKAIPNGSELVKAIPDGTAVLNFSVPNPLHTAACMPTRRINVFEGGLLAYDPTATDIRFTMRLVPGLTYACHAGTMVHAYRGWTHHEVGPVNLNLMAETLKAAQELGFSVPLIK